MRIGLTITAKNERPLLRPNLEWHRSLGIERAFVFDDGATDGTFEMVADLDWVEVRQSASPAERAREVGRTDLAHFTGELNTHHNARIMLNYVTATRLAVAADLDWLACLDADELLSPTPDLLRMLVDGRGGAILVRPLEALGDATEGEALPFAGEIRFRSSYPTGPEASSIVAGYRGHTLGKSIIDPHSGLVPISPHRVKGCPRLAGWLLHYHACGEAERVRKAENKADRPEMDIGGLPYTQGPDVADPPIVEVMAVRDFFAGER